MTVTSYWANIALGDFESIDAQSGVTSNSYVFKVTIHDVKMYLKEDIDETVELIVEVFNPAKAQRDHNKYVVKKQDVFQKFQARIYVRSVQMKD